MAGIPLRKAVGTAAPSTAWRAYWVGSAPDHVLGLLQAARYRGGLQDPRRPSIPAHAVFKTRECRTWPTPPSRCKHAKANAGATSVRGAGGLSALPSHLNERAASRRAVFGPQKSRPTPTCFEHRCNGRSSSTCTCRTFFAPALAARGTRGASPTSSYPMLHPWRTLLLAYRREGAMR